MLKLLETDYFNDQIEMHYALLQSAEKIGPVLHTHDFFEIFLIIEGEIRHIVNGQEIRLRAGTLTLIRPNDAHFYRPVPHVGCHMINLAVSRQAVSDLFAYLGDGFQTGSLLAPPLPPMVTLSQTVKLIVQKRFEGLNSMSLDAAAAKRTALRMLLFELITQYVQPFTVEKTGGEVPDWLTSACDQMQHVEHLAGGVPRLLELSAVSGAHLSRTMRRYYETTPTDYVNKTRLNYAANRLIHGDQPIVEIVGEVGFESLSYFYTLFKEAYGVTPRQYRQSHQPHLPHASN